MRKILCIALISSAAFVVAAAANQSSETKAEKQAKRSASIEAAFKKLDADKSGSISLDEFLASQDKERQERATKVFERMDADGNGQVTLEEFESFRKARQKAKRDKKKAEIPAKEG